MFTGRGAALGSLLLSLVILGGSRSSFPAGSGVWAAASSLERCWVPPARTLPGRPLRRGAAPPALQGSIIAQRSHFAFIAFIYYPGASACFLRQLSGYIVADKQCWSVFIRQPKFITCHLFIYLVGLWWWPVFFFQ